MAFKLKFEELDDTTRGYLTQVKTRAGAGSPGVFVKLGYAAPWWWIILGPIIMIATIGISWGSDVVYDDPTRVALLQTAGFMVGGWMILAAFRTWFSAGSPRTAGRWVYADPLYAYTAAGEQVTITPTAGITEAKSQHHYSSGSYTGSTVTVIAEGAKPEQIRVKGERAADGIATYYNYLAWGRGPEGGDRGRSGPVGLGTIARFVARNDREPTAEELEPSQFDSIPETPEKARSARIAIFWPLFLIAAGVGVFFVMAKANVPVRDDAIYEAVKDSGKVPILRAYLLDPRNTRHRDEVVKKISALYDPAVSRIRSSPAADPDLKAAMLKVLESLRKAEQPVVSIRVKEENSPDTSGESRTDKLRTKLADLLAAKIGKELIAFVQAPEGVNAHFDIVYRLEATGASGYHAVGTLIIRTAIEEKPAAESRFVQTKSWGLGVIELSSTDLADQLSKSLAGATPVAPMPGPFDVEF